MFLTESEKRRFYKRIVIQEDCHVWTGTICNGGYGVMNIRGRMIRVHRIAFFLEHGKISESSAMCIDHLCRNRLCVNPKHLEQVTKGTNVLRGIGIAAMNTRKTYCSNGHEYTKDNTYINKYGHRSCKICMKAQDLKKCPRLLANSLIAN